MIASKLQQQGPLSTRALDMYKQSVRLVASPHTPISTQNIWIKQDRAGATLQVMGEAVTVPLLSFSTFWRGAAFKLVLLPWQTGVRGREQGESHPGCNFSSALGAHAPDAELDKPVRYFGEKHTGCPHCNRRLRKQGHMVEPHVCRHKNGVPAYSSTASSAPGRKNSDARFLASTFSWKNSYKFHSMLWMYRWLFPYKITNWTLNWYD